MPRLALLLVFLLALPARAADRPVTLAFGSCASDLVFPEQPIWGRLPEAQPDAFFALGDTPYIDSTDPGTQRRRYREFFAMPQVAALRAAVPYYATWDDHDFGRNDTDGTLKDKHHSRDAFIEALSPPRDGEGTPELRPASNPSFGENGQGIYTKVSVGCVDIFLIDARWFAGTEPSFADPERKTLLGRQQWDWLRRELRASTASFKVLATGMIWYDAVRPNKRDYWGFYPHEREALMRFIAKEKVEGVVLVGGDIHRSRALRHAAGRWGNPSPMVELITSPLAQNVIEAANAPDQALLWDVGVRQTAMLVDASCGEADPTLTARWIDHEGKELFRLVVRRSELRPAP
jgi:alkaline phosphatase D